MNSFVRKLITEWRKMDLPLVDARMIVAVSGGADSTALALALADLAKRGKLKNSFIVAHYNHNLRGAESLADADFVKDLAEKCNFPFVSELGIVAPKGNLEQNARTARYEFLHRIAFENRAEFVITAHTLDDQAETFLMRLLRGSGASGLGAMRKNVTFGGVFAPEEGKQTKTGEFFAVRLVRPLLCWARRAETEDFCVAQKVSPRHDAMNEDEDFFRVAVRRRLLPLINELAPRADERLAEAAFRLQSESDALQMLLPIDEETLTDKISLNRLREIAPVVRIFYLRRWIELNTGTRRRISAKNLEAVANLAFSQKSGRLVELPNGWRVTRQNGFLHIFQTFV